MKRQSILLSLAVLGAGGFACTPPQQGSFVVELARSRGDSGGLVVAITGPDWDGVQPTGNHLVADSVIGNTMMLIFVGELSPGTLGRLTNIPDIMLHNEYRVTVLEAASWSDYAQASLSDYAVQLRVR